MAVSSTRTRRKEKRSVPTGVAYVYATPNNTHVTITGPAGEVLVVSSSGRHGFKGSRKATPYAAQMAAEHVSKIAMEVYGMRTVSVLVRGPGGGRDSAVRAFQAMGLMVISVRDNTPIPHNGCRPKKRRRC